MADLDDLARQSAGDALVAILGKLGDFRGESRFTTWARKFAVFEAGAKVRRHAWQGREVLLEPGAWLLLADRDPRPSSMPKRATCSTRYRKGSTASSLPASARYWSRWRSTMSPLTCSPSA